MIDQTKFLGDAVVDEAAVAKMICAEQGRLAEEDIKALAAIVDALNAFNTQFTAADEARAGG